MGRRALVLFAHGGRNPDWAGPFERLRAIIQAQLPETVVALAFLELMKPDLIEAVHDLVHAGCEEVIVVPVFLAQGGHLMRDLPRLAGRLKQENPGLVLKVADAAGEDEDVLQALAQYCVRSLDR